MYESVSPSFNKTVWICIKGGSYKYKVVHGFCMYIFKQIK